MTSTKSVGSRKGIRETRKFVNRAKMFVRARITSPKLKNIFFFNGDSSSNGWPSVTIFWTVKSVFVYKAMNSKGKWQQQVLKVIFPVFFPNTFQQLNSHAKSCFHVQKILWNIQSPQTDKNTFHRDRVNKIQIHSCKVSDMQNDYFNVVTHPRFENIL